MNCRRSVTTRGGRVRGVSTRVGGLRNRLLGTCSLIRRNICAGRLFVDHHASVRTSIRRTRKHEGTIRIILRQLRVTGGARSSLVPRARILLRDCSFVAGSRHGSLLGRVIRGVRCEGSERNDVRVSLCPRLPGVWSYINVVGSRARRWQHLPIFHPMWSIDQAFPTQSLL